jgi:hypothetical protein
MQRRISIGDFLKEYLLNNKKIILKLSAHKELSEDSQGTNVRYTFDFDAETRVRGSGYTNSETYANNPNESAQAFLEKALKLRGLEYKITNKENRFYIDITTPNPTRKETDAFSSENINHYTSSHADQQATAPEEMGGLMKKVMEDINNPTHGSIKGDTSPDPIIEILYRQEVPDNSGNTLISLSLIYGMGKKEITIAHQSEHYLNDKRASIKESIADLLIKSADTEPIATSFKMLDATMKKDTSIGSVFISKA